MAGRNEGVAESSMDLSDGSLRSNISEAELEETVTYGGLDWASGGAGVLRPYEN